MKKAIFIMLFLVLVGTLVIAQGQGGTQGEGAGVDESGQQGAGQARVRRARACSGSRGSFLGEREGGR